MILVGTSGYSYPGWRGVLYPEEMRPDGFLAAYAERFPAVEINSTYYGIPKPAVFERMVSQTPDGFEFIVKANRATTHGHSDNDVAGTFHESLGPLLDAGRLSGILAQFPWGFRNDEANRRYLAELADRHADHLLPADIDGKQKPKETTSSSLNRPKKSGKRSSSS